MVDLKRTERVLGPLRVGLRSDVTFTRQYASGGPRYVAHDPVSFQNHAFSPEDYRILTAITRRRSLADTLASLVDRGLLENNDHDKQGFYKFVLWLHGIGLIRLPITGGDAAYGRKQQRIAARRPPWYAVLMSHRVPLFRPDRFLTRGTRYVGWLFGPVGIFLWVALMASVVWRLGDSLPLVASEASGLLELSNLPLLWLLLVSLKVIHEFGHAFASRRFGASVPEMGVQFIMMTPCAYIDANASWTLRNARQRAAVAVAGMYIESFVAGTAALVWAGTTEGALHDIAFNILALASVVTVLFNLNPLTKFDGYYLFSDLVGVYNLQQRAAAHLKGWVEHVALGKPRPRGRYTQFERVLYSVYGPCAFLYRVSLAFTLTVWVLLQWPGAGLFLGAVFAWAMIIRPSLRLLGELWSGAGYADRRTRARLLACALVLLLPPFAGMLPVSFSVCVPGIVDVEQRQVIRSPISAFVESVAVSNGDRVKPGTALCTLRNPELELRRLRLQGELEAERESFDTIELDDSTQASIHKSRIAYLAASVAELDRRIEASRLTAEQQGTVAGHHHGELAGTFVQQGEELMRVEGGHRLLRIVLTEHQLSRARLEIGSPAEVRLSCAPASTLKAVVRQVTASASRVEVPEALTIAGGGTIWVQSVSQGLAVADQPYFHVLIEIPDDDPALQWTGTTARVRLPARAEILGQWVHRQALAFINVWRMST